MSKITATARVQVIVEVTCTQPWPQECQIDQLFRQAKDEAIQKVSKLLCEHGENIRMGGQPTVIGILTETK